MLENRISIGGLTFPILALLLFIVLTLITGCGKNDVARIVGPAGTPSLVGEWKGTMTAVSMSGGDTLLVRTFLVRIAFADSTFSYRYVNEHGSTIPPYAGAGTFERADSLVYLSDTTSYDEWVDRSMTPISGEPYSLTLSHSSSVLSWSHNYGQSLIRHQRLDLVRP